MFLPVSRREWRLSNLITAKSLLAIAYAEGPKCCKQCTFLALAEAVRFVQESFGIEITESRNLHCEFSDMNKECLRTGCKFYNPE